MDRINPKNTADVERTGRAARPERTGKSDASARTQFYGQAQSARSTTDGINISSNAGAAKILTERLKELPSIRGERVAELRQVIESGAYAPAAVDIADAIIRDEQT